MWRQPRASRDDRTRLGGSCWLAAGLVVLGLRVSPVAQAQIDPAKRHVVQAGYSLPLVEHGPMAAYAFYYFNKPDYPRTNQTLRMAIVPVYLDSELGFRGALGPSTDLAVGLAGGGFADTYNEIRQGNYLTDESFTGHTADLSGVLYHLFNPEDRMPLYGIIRAGAHGSFYEPDDDTASDFEMPANRATPYVRTGLRLGGREPYLTPELAGELSIWNETQFRFNHHAYGFNDDRDVEDYSSLFWARALLAYTFPKSRHFLEASVTAGASLNADRFSAFRLGGSLNLVSEFPLTLPGYHIQEISADQFVQLSARYVLPLDNRKQWALNAYSSMAVVDYLDGLNQPGNFHSGVGGGLVFQSASRTWQLATAYAYGINAIREERRGGHTLTFQLQYDFDADIRADGGPFWDPLRSASTWRGIFNIFTGR